MTDDEAREEALKRIPSTWRVDDLAHVMRPAETKGAWVSVWMWIEDKEG